MDPKNLARAVAYALLAVFLQKQWPRIYAPATVGTLTGYTRLLVAGVAFWGVWEFVRWLP